MTAKAGTRIGLAIGLTAALLCLATAWRIHERSAAPVPQKTPTYAGAAVCATCHPNESQRWAHSHHALAMQEPTEATVLGDFNARAFTDGKASAKFFRRDGLFFVHTDGADGQTADYPIAYTFGVEPLQQYLVRMPGGRLQALGFAWDSRPKADGGQRWFHLYSGHGVEPGETLHWTGREQNWNFMCASCHSTGLVKNYDPRQDTYDTQWSDMNVACEACHGPGSAHVDWAHNGGRGPDKGLQSPLHEVRGQWRFVENAPIARRVDEHKRQPEAQMCYPCHAHRQPLVQQTSTGQPFLDQYSLTLLEPGLYHADGQLLEESFEVGSFLQSRMHRAGVTCIDCHEPHGLRLRAQGNALCAQCHRPEVFDQPRHHQHPVGSPGAQCISCHMPTKTFMRVDVRHDHAFRIPRPDLTVKYGVPNACTQCHDQMTPQVAQDHIERWHGSKRKNVAVLTPDPAALMDIARDTDAAPIVRATAYQMMSPFDVRPHRSDIVAGLRNKDALVRIGALHALTESAVDERMQALPLAADPVRAVRIEAARITAGIPANLLTAEQTHSRQRALEELFAAESVAADRPENHLNVAAVAADLGDLPRAEAALIEAIRLSHARNDPMKAQATHLLGLLRVREQRREEALELLAKAVALQPREPRFAYVYAIALRESGRAPEAIKVLEQALTQAPNDEAILSALAQLERERGREAAARAYRDRLAKIREASPPAPR